MTKKLLFNGCSMTAGDALTWDKHYPDIDWFNIRDTKHPKYSIDEMQAFFLNYRADLRILDNLGSHVGKLTGKSVVDLSDDGNCNQNICMTTIQFLEELSTQERKNYHVCIGWSAISRRMAWEPNLNEFVNLTIGELDHVNKIYFHQYIKESMINRADADHIINYFHNIVSLQNYLKANAITYTFWNTLNHINCNLEILYTGNNKKIIPYKHKIMFNQTDWLSFDDCKYPWLGLPWSLTTLYKGISKKNNHPNLESVIELAKKVAAHISTASGN